MKRGTNQWLARVGRRRLIVTADWKPEPDLDHFAESLARAVWELDERRLPTIAKLATVLRAVGKQKRES